MPRITLLASALICPRNASRPLHMLGRSAGASARRHAGLHLAGAATPLDSRVLQDSPMMASVTVQPGRQRLRCRLRPRRLQLVRPPSCAEQASEQ